MTRNWRGQLLAKTVLAGVSSLATVGGMAMLSTASAQAAPQAAPAAKGDKEDIVVVTGSIILRSNADSLSPLTVQSADDIEKRGQTTISDVIQNLSGNNAGALPNSFSANGAFASGASAASLRGLTTNSTLVLVDGVRVAYYPLADDGTRNFVDLNTIPSSIVDRVEVLKDGASSTYGADAIAGVINVITKKNFQGSQFKIEAGTSEKGGGGTWFGSGLWGKGDLATDGYNFYIGGEYEKDLALYSRTRDYPFNTNDFSKLCATSVLGTTATTPGGITCRTNGIVNGLQYNNQFAGIGTDTVPVVRPFGTANAAGTGNYQLLNPAAGCGKLTPVTITPANATNPATGTVLAGFNAPVNLCQQDFRHDYSVISPADERASLSGRLTLALNDHAEMYVSGNYYQNDVFYTGSPNAIRDTASPAALGVSLSTANIALPPYVCPGGTLTGATFLSSCSTLVNGVQTPIAGARLNPNNPYAASGQYARIFYNFVDIPVSTRDFSQTFRVAGGIQGDFDSFGGNYRYDANVTASQTNLTVTVKGRPFYPNLLSAIADGSYNFANPTQNTQAVRDFISPDAIQKSRSQLLMGQFNISKDLFELPGGSAQLGLSVAARYEALDNPSLNSDAKGVNNRYLRINPFGATGSRDTQAVSFELDLPVLTQLDIDLAGRYDKYSTGQDHFSPKAGVRYKPFDMLTLRSTWSQGFRIPSFAESFADPTTGFTTVSAPASCNAAHGGVGNTYCNTYSLGLTSTSSPNLQPETSENFNVGFVVEPIQNWTFSVDYYRIEKNDVIAGGDYLPAIAAYYAGQPIPAGLTVIPDLPDVNFPNAQPRIGFIQYGLVNLDSQTTDGYDINVAGHMELPGGFEWTTSADATYLIRLNQTFPDGSTQHYAGSLGPYVITSASGTPKWRANWQNTISNGPFSVTGTLYYTKGYNETAEDNGGRADDDTCQSGVGSGTPATYRDSNTIVVCKVDDSVYFDLHGQWDFNQNFTFYADVKNLFGEDPAYDPTTYGASNYNPAWGTSGIIGRYFKVGVKATF